MYANFIHWLGFRKFKFSPSDHTHILSWLHSKLSKEHSIYLHVPLSNWSMVTIPHYIYHRCLYSHSICSFSHLRQDNFLSPPIENRRLKYLEQPQTGSYTFHLVYLVGIQIFALFVIFSELFIRVLFATCLLL